MGQGEARHSEARAFVVGSSETICTVFHTHNRDDRIRLHNRQDHTPGNQSGVVYRFKLRNK